MPLSEADRIAGLRAILASPANAERLQGIGFVADVLASLHADPATSDVPALLRAGVDAALEALDARARTIVVRCDIARETHRTVAADLGIGERYFYRERRRALLELAQQLLTARATPVARRVQSEPMSALLGTAAAFRNAGRTRESAAMLAAAYRDDASAHIRAEIALELARLAADKGDRADVARWAQISSRHFKDRSDSAADTTLAACELELLGIRADVAVGRIHEAKTRTRAVAQRLTPLAGHPDRNRVAAAIGSTYTALSDSQVMLGAYADGLALALEGRERFRDAADAAPGGEIDALVAVAQARFFATGSAVRAAADLDLAYARAIELGRSRDIATIAASTAIFCALRGDGARTVAFTRAALTIGRQTLTANERVGTGLDLIAVAFMRDDVAGAAKIVHSARPYARGILADVLTIADAEVHLRGGDPVRALELVRRAGTSIEQAGNARFLGSAWRVEAEALAASGQRSAAIQRIAQALERLRQSGHPVTLARALTLSATLTGNRRHAAAARDLEATLRAS